VFGFDELEAESFIGDGDCYKRRQNCHLNVLAEGVVMATACVGLVIPWIIAICEAGFVTWSITEHNNCKEAYYDCLGRNDGPNTPRN
jgi:hypothetical protein